MSVQDFPFGSDHFREDGVVDPRALVNEFEWAAVSYASANDYVFQCQPHSFRTVGTGVTGKCFAIVWLVAISLSVIVKSPFAVHTATVWLQDKLDRGKAICRSKAVGDTQYEAIHEACRFLLITLMRREVRALRAYYDYMGRLPAGEHDEGRLIRKLAVYAELLDFTTPMYGTSGAAGDGNAIVSVQVGDHEAIGEGRSESEARMFASMHLLFKMISDEDQPFRLSHAVPDDVSSNSTEVDATNPDNPSSVVADVQVSRLPYGCDLI
jgi:hypothetical protein